jgi:hypothetical protein
MGDLGMPQKYCCWQFLIVFTVLSFFGHLFSDHSRAILVGRWIAFFVIDRGERRTP